MPVTWEQVQQVMAALSMNEARCERLSTETQAAVYRTWTEDGKSVILKVTDRRAAITREVRVDAVLRRRRGIRFAPILAHGERGDLGYVVYADDGLTEVAWTKMRDRQVMSTMAAIHRMSVNWIREDADAHTPGIEAIEADLETCDATEVDRALAELSPDGQAIGHTTTAPLLHAVVQWRSLMDVGGAVFCHGDLHRGNVMISRHTGLLHVIDWEFAHLDSPLYDLFQFLDATSPHTPQRPVLSREDAVEAYYTRQRTRLIDVTKAQFVTAYHLYAGAYLIWITLRVAADYRAQRFSIQALQRQQAENARALQEIAQTLAKSGLLTQEVLR